MKKNKKLLIIGLVLILVILLGTAIYTSYSILDSMDLILDVEADIDEAYIGDEIIWTIKVTNDEYGSLAEEVSVENIIPDGLAFEEIISKSHGELVEDDWDIGALNMGEVAELVIKTTVTISSGTITNNLMVTSPDYDWNLSNNSASDTVTILPEATEETTSVNVSVVWIDANDQDSSRPKEVTVKLKADGILIDSAVISLENNWEHTFSDLLKYYDSGEEIIYTLEQDALDEYSIEYSNFDWGEEEKENINIVILNTYTKDIVVDAIWDDADDQDGIRPKEVTVKLKADGILIDSAIISLENGWEHTFSDLPKYHEYGEEIIYTLEQDAPDEYSIEYRNIDWGEEEKENIHIEIWNTHTPYTKDIVVTAIWDDDNDRDGLRPDSVTLDLYADGEKVNTETLDANNGWNYTFEDFNKFNNGKEIEYIIETVNVPNNYDVSYDGYTITYNHTPERTSVDASIIWNDDNNRDGLRPDNVTLDLYADGEKVNTATFTGTGDNWYHTFENLYRYDSGKEIVYTIKEVDVSNGYETSTDGFVITNVHIPESMGLTVTKIWDDDYNRDGLRPKDVSFTLYADGEEVETVKLSGTGDKWFYTFENLYKNTDGKEIDYTIKEVGTPDGYTSSVDDLTITYKHIPETKSVTVTLLWDDESDQDKLRPKEVTLTLFGADKTYTGKLTGNGKEWSYTFDNVIVNQGGKPIEYTIKNNEIDKYVTKIENLTITYKHEIKIEEEISKDEVEKDEVVKDDNNEDDGKIENPYTNDKGLLAILVTAIGVTGLGIVLVSKNKFVKYINN